MHINTPNGGFDLPIPWWGTTLFIAAVIFIVLFIGGKCLARHTYCCPQCGKSFRKKWYHMALSRHIGSDRYLKCPHCGKKDWCSVKDDWR